MPGYVPCRYCGIPLHFEETQKSKSGKHIPLQENNLPHSCSSNPNNRYFRSLNKNSAAKAISKSEIQKIDDFALISEIQDQVEYANIRLAAHILELKVKEKRKEGCVADLFWPPDDNFADTTEHKTSSNSEEI
jgi:hypothetical protein